MQAGWADSRNREKDSREYRAAGWEYAPDRPKECRYCYFWRGKRKGCSQKKCYYLLPEEAAASGRVPGNPLSRGFGEISGGCRSCPYGKHSPCIGYCMKKILQEMRQRKQSAGKEGERLAGRGK